MQTTRKAILVSNPGEIDEENYCKGVFADIEHYMALLQQPQGGFWEPNEIICLNRPSIIQLKSAIYDLASFDYSFIAFSGHGWYSNTRQDTILKLGGGQELPSIELRSNSNKRTIILDCCREVYNEPTANALQKKYALSRAIQRRVPHPERCRDHFFQNIASASPGIVVIHSAAIGETAGDDEIIGGRYTASLITKAAEWAEMQANGAGMNTTDELSIVAAHDVAAAVTKVRSGNRQNPTIDKPRTAMNYFPFAVFA